MLLKDQQFIDPHHAKTIPANPDGPKKAGSIDLSVDIKPKLKLNPTFMSKYSVRLR